MRMCACACACPHACCCWPPACMHVLRVRMRVRALLLASCVHAGIRLKCQPFARDWRSLSHICTCHVHTRPPSHSHARTPPRLAPCTHARPCCCTEDCVDCARAREKAKCCVKESLRVLAKLAQNSSVSCGPSNASQMTLTKLLLPKCQHTHHHTVPTHHTHAHKPTHTRGHDTAVHAARAAY